MTQAGMETSNPFASLTVQKDTDEQSEEEPNADEGKDYDKGADKVFTIYYGQFNKTVEVCVNVPEKLLVRVCGCCAGLLQV